MSARPAPTAEGENLVAVFTGELAAAGLRAWPSTIGGARAFCARYTSPERFAPPRSTSSLGFDRTCASSPAG